MPPLRFASYILFSRGGEMSGKLLEAANANVQMSSLNEPMLRLECFRRSSLPRHLKPIGDCGHRFSVLSHLLQPQKKSISGSSNDKKAEQRIAFGQRPAILPTDLMI